jgi:hypothetical protein
MFRNADQVVKTMSVLVALEAREISISIAFLRLSIAVCDDAVLRKVLILLDNQLCEAEANG